MNMPPSVALGLDAGGTATRWVLLSGETVLARGLIGIVSGHLLLTGSQDKVFEELQRIKEDIKALPRPTCAFAGVSGTSAGSKSSRAIEEMLASIFELDESYVKVTTDLWITYHACFRPGAGIVVYSGTGSAAIHVTAQGKELLVGGLGYLIDDAGSGYWIGQMGVRSLLRMEEEAAGQGWSSPIGKRVKDVLGEGTWSAVRARVYGGDRSSLALLAPAIGDAALLDDDPTARNILIEAGRELGRLVLILRKRVGRLPFALSGGAGTLPFVVDGLEQVVGERVEPGRADAALAAAHLALALITVS